MHYWCSYHVGSTCALKDFWLLTLVTLDHGVLKTENKNTDAWASLPEIIDWIEMIEVWAQVYFYMLLKGLPWWLRE